MAHSPSFSYNVAFTVPVNPDEGVEPMTYAQLWQGIKRGGRHPDYFAPYVASCEVLSDGLDRFSRRLTLADGAVHTAKGETLDQDVRIADMLHVESTTVGTGAKSTFLLSFDASDGKGDKDLYLTAMYELKLEKVEPGSAAANKIKADYRELARKACRAAVGSIREWKSRGLLEQWAKEDDALAANQKEQPADQ